MGHNMKKSVLRQKCALNISTFSSKHILTFYFHQLLTSSQPPSASKQFHFGKMVLMHLYPPFISHLQIYRQMHHQT